MEPLPTEFEMHALATGRDAPDQLFMLAVPREQNHGGFALTVEH